MGFKIFASGSTGFHYGKDKCEDGSTFELIKVVTALQSLDIASMGTLAITGTGAYIDYKAQGITDLMVALAREEMFHNLSNAMCFLAMLPNSSDGQIFVAATEKNIFSPDVSRSATYKFSPGDMPGAEFITTIWRSLKDTGLDNFGVLLQLSVVITKFYNHIDDSTTPKLLIDLTN